MANHSALDILVWVDWEEGMSADAKGTDFVNTQTQPVVHPFRMRKKALPACFPAHIVGGAQLAAVSSKRATPGKEEEEAATRRRSGTFCVSEESATRIFHVDKEALSVFDVYTRSEWRGG